MNIRTAGILCIAIGTSLFFQCANNKNENAGGASETKAETSSVNELPSMTVTFVGGGRVNVNELSGKMVLVLFQPDCDHCQREASAIRENLESFTDYKLYFISSSSLPELQQFANDYGLTSPNIRLGQTSVESIISNFGSIPAPSVYIYSEERKLVQKFNGETEIEKILQHL